MISAFNICLDDGMKKLIWDNVYLDRNGNWIVIFSRICSRLFRSMRVISEMVNHASLT